MKQPIIITLLGIVMLSSVLAEEPILIKPNSIFADVSLSINSVNFLNNSSQSNDISQRYNLALGYSRYLDDSSEISIGLHGNYYCDQVQSSSSYNIGLNMGYKYYWKSTVTNLHPYLGVNLAGGMSNYFWAGTNTSSALTGALTPSIGVEYWLTENIILSAGFTVPVSYMYAYSTSGPISSTWNVSIGLSGPTLGLVFRF